MIDYEEKYNKLLEHVENLYNRLAGSEKEYLQQVTREEIPELAEKEDEKIRKELLAHLLQERRSATLKVNHPMWDRMISWVEKQEQNPYSGVSFKYNGHIWGMCARDNGIDVLLDGKLISHITQDEQKQEWNEEDEKMQKLLIAILEVNHPNAYFKANEFDDSNMCVVYTEELIAWLKSIKDRFFPQSKQEWNEENDKFRKYIISVIEALPTTDGLFDSVLTKDKFLSWLKAPKSYDVVENHKSITIPKFKVNDVITSSNNTALKYRIKEVGVKNKIGEYEYVVEDVSDNPEYKGRIHKISIEKVDNWGILIERPVFYEYDE